MKTHTHQKYIVLARCELENILSQMRPEQRATVVCYIRETSADSVQHAVDRVTDPLTGETLAP